MTMKILILLLISQVAFGQNVHVHQMGKNFDPAKVKLLKERNYKVHPFNEKGLVQQELEFQNKIIYKAGLTKKLKGLNYMQKEKLMDLLEANNSKEIPKSFPMIHPKETKALLRAFYE